MFQDLDGSPFYDAIEKVTQGYKGAKFAHIGIIVDGSDGEPVVLEAIGRGVYTTPVDTFLARSHDNNNHPKVIVGRLKPQYRHLIEPALERLNGYLGKSYDHIFDIKNDSYYCSELVYLSYLDESGESLFKLYPMTFIDPDTRETFPAWVDYYQDLGVNIPEGEPGLNPGGISRSPVLDIVHMYGNPDGMK